ncbi:MAG: class I SAM-dependent methyltransferase [Pseudomonadota bacterium]
MTDAREMVDEYRDWKAWDRDSFAKLPPEVRRYYEVELRTADAWGDGLSVLEIGFGNGGFAAFCRDQGWTYSGTEIDPELVERATSEGFDVSLAEPDLVKLFGDRKFDVIAAFDVMEHLTLDENIAFLKQARALMAPEGRLVARFPSGDSPFSFGMQNGDMTHRSHIGSGIVRQLCIASGMRPRQIRGPVYPVTGLGLKRGLRRGLIAALRAPVRRFVQIVFMDNQPRVIDPNMVVVLSMDVDPAD